MKTGYQQKTSIATGRPAYGTTFANPPIGALMEDYEYNADTSGRHLDVYNGRFCNTPEFPSGTFAYFTTVWEDQTETKEYTVTVTNETDGNRYRIDGELHPNLTFIKGSTYKFILSDLSNQNHDLLFSDASDGFHGAGTTYTTHFELHESEETDLVFKILALAGIVIKDPGLYQQAAAEEVKQIQQEKQ